MGDLVILNKDLGGFCKESLRNELWQANLKLGDLIYSSDQGRNSITLFSVFEMKNVFIKLTNKRNSYPAEIWVYEKMREKSILCPDVLFYCEKLISINMPCIVLTEVKGKNLLDTKLSRKDEMLIYSDLGGILNSIHHIEVNDSPYGFGVFSNNFVESFDSWLDFIMSVHNIINVFDNLIANNLISQVEYRKLDNLVDHVASHSFEKKLIYGDFGPDHVFIMDDRVSGIIDPGDSFLGPSEYDISYLKIYIDDNNFNSFLGSYYDDIDFDMVNVYYAIICADKANGAIKLKNKDKFKFFIEKLNLSLRRV